MTPGCQAKLPIPAIAPRLWLICGQPAERTDRYRCPCGHERDGSTCAEHAPAPGEVGCSRCWDAGHECPMTVIETPNDPACK